MYKTARVPIYYDSKFEKAFEEQLQNYDSAYKHAIAIFHDDAECMREYFKESGLEKNMLRFHMVRGMVTKYDAHAILTKFRANHANSCHALIQRAAFNSARIAVERFIESNNEKRKSGKRLAADGRKPRARDALTLLRNQHTIVSKDIPRRRKNNTLYLPGVGNVSLVRKLSSGDMKSFTLTRKDGCIRLNVAFEIPDPAPKTEGLEVAVDFGVKNAVVAIVSDGKTNYSLHMNPPENSRRNKNDDITKVTSEMSKKKRGSNSYRKLSEKLKRMRAKIRHRQENWERETARFLVGISRVVAMEDLKLAGMIGRKFNKVGNRDLNREMNYSRIGYLKDAILWENKKAGTSTRLVDPAYTSQTCCSCGNISKESRKSQAEFVCVRCGFEMHADENAGINIGRRANLAVGRAVVRCESAGHLLGLLKKKGSLVNERLLEHPNYAGYAGTPAAT